MVSLLLITLVLGCSTATLVNKEVSREVDLSTQIVKVHYSHQCRAIHHVIATQTPQEPWTPVGSKVEPIHPLLKAYIPFTTGKNRSDGI